MDHFSPVAPAHIRVLVLPVGRVERTRFLRILHRLQSEASVIPLADADIQKKDEASDDGFLLSPAAFPRGSLLYHYTSAAIAEQHQLLSPFELFRAPLLVLGIVDGLPKDQESVGKELDYATAYLKERHPRVIRRQLIVLNNDDDTLWNEQVEAVSIANADTSNDASLRTAICAISERFLSDLTMYAKAMQASPTILTPGQTARSLQKTATSLREDERRPSSGRSTPPRPFSPTDENSPARPSAKAPSVPATSFDQIPGVTSPSSNASRPESRASNKGKGGKRSSSQDRVVVQGFGSSTSQEKVRLRGRARVGIVYGSIYMIAGQWTKALSLLVEHTTKSRSLQDHLWHAKGLENMLVCLLLLTWSNVDFQLPNICEPVTDRSGPVHAARVAAETRAAAEGTKQNLQIFRLSAAIPDLLRQILVLYRSTEGSLELSFIVIAEATVRLSKLSALLSLAGGQFSPSTLRSVVVAQMEGVDSTPYTSNSPTFRQAKLSKSSIADLLAQAVPNADDLMTVSDHMRILAGIASTYAMLRLDRKKAITVKDLVVRLTRALIQARKLGAAEMGIHPAASLSTDTGAETLMSIIEESKGIQVLMADVSNTYGATLADTFPSERPRFFETETFGNSSLKFNLLRELAGFCEASPDPYGVLLLTTSLLRAAGPNAAIDIALGPVQVANSLSREEQMHLATVIHRTVAVSRHLGLTDAQATYWDPFLLRGIEIRQPSAEKAVINRSKISQADKVPEHTTPGNPLLYDPNASRPGTAEKQIFLLVENEESECLITLQNPFDIPVDIEQLELIADGVKLSSQHQPITLGPLRFQQVSLMVTPESVGAAKITGCRIKMQGCRSQVFPIVEHAWSAGAALVVKDLGLSARRPPQMTSENQCDPKSIGVEPETVSASILGALPTLMLAETSIHESGLMLLEGEKRPLALTLRNNGTIPACVFEIKDTAEIFHFTGTGNDAHLEPTHEMSAILITPTESVTVNLVIQGKAGVSHTQAAFYYSANEPDATKYARAVTVSLDITVNAALQIQNFEVEASDNAAGGDTGGTELLVSFDVRNAWPKSISFECLVDGADMPGDLTDRRRLLVPGEIRRVDVLVSRANDTFVDDLAAAKSQFLDRLEVLWKVDDRSGAIDLHSLTLPTDSLSMIRGNPVAVMVSVQDSATRIENKGLEFTVGTFVFVRIKLINRSKQSGPSHVVLALQGVTGSLAAERSVSVVGSLQHLVSPLAEGEERVVEVGLCPLLAGVLCLEAIVRPVAATDASFLSDWTERASLSLSIL